MNVLRPLLALAFGATLAATGCVLDDDEDEDDDCVIACEDKHEECAIDCDDDVCIATCDDDLEVCKTDCE